MDWNGWVDVTPEMIDAVQKEQARTGIAPADCVNHMDTPPLGLRGTAVYELICGRRTTFPKTHYDAVVAAYAALPNAGAKAKPVRRAHTERARPRPPEV